MKDKKLPPGKAIRKYCVQCSCCMGEVRKCENKDCPAYPLRMGKRPCGISLQTVIRVLCLDCKEDKKSVRECENDFERLGTCPLWSYRFGRRPKIMPN